MSDIGFPKPNRKIETERLELQYRNIEDAALCFQLIDSSREHLAPWMPWEDSTLKASDSEAYFKVAQDQWEKGKMYDFSIFLKGTRTIIGSGGIHTIHWDKRTCDIGYWLGEKYEGYGYATEASLALENVARNLGIHRVRIECDPKNVRSAAVAKRMGYVQEALVIDDFHNGEKYRDTLCFVKLLNPQVPGFITDNFPRGYGLKKVETNEYKKIAGIIDKNAWNDSLIIRNPELMEYKTPETKFDKFLRLNYILYFEDKPIGCFYGNQSHIDTFQMSSAYIFPEHQGRKLYTRVMDIMIKEVCELGFLRITSLHIMTHPHIIAAKLKRGFKITGTSINLYAGTMVELTYFNNPTREKILNFRSGQKFPDLQIREIFKI